ncbi:hypothetical protein [Cesiribacter andamanensis]|uniref:DUF4136 domain-containing protein n=1 Tax=Cesiribacter andamanensis AMV16 TaxID=1279009 RepID=M7N3D0_9BACT|nr:hypothetical protein [Cesiribacter andamanensis]EMR01772.1 hypothetical protein ADICEAN_03092 [Cesiribacter andamanensis AMV16]
MNKLLFFSCFLFVAAHGLQAQKADFRQLPDTIWVAVTANEAFVEPEMAHNFKLAAQASFVKANLQKKQALKFILTQDSLQADVHYRLIAYRLVSRTEQNTALALTLLGVATPIALAAAGVPFPVGFYSTPQNRYMTSVHYSPQMAGLGFQDVPELVLKVSTGYASSDAKNERKIAADFGRWMENVSKKWNKNHLRAVRRHSGGPVSALAP